MTLKKFLDEANRLIISQLDKPRIKKTRIQHLENYRAKLEAMDEPNKTLALTFLDDMVAFAHAVNSGDGDEAERLADEIKATLAEIDGSVKTYSP